MRYEYTAIPAPTRGEKDKDAKTPTERYALTLATELNRMAADGWEYVRADILPSEERSGLTGRTTTYHNLLIFRKEAASQPAPKQEGSTVPQPEYPVAAQPMRAPEPTPQLPEAAAPQPTTHATGTETGEAKLAADTEGTPPTPPAPRTRPDRD